MVGDERRLDQMLRFLVWLVDGGVARMVCRWVCIAKLPRGCGWKPTDAHRRDTVRKREMLRDLFQRIKSVLEDNLEERDSLW